MSITFQVLQDEWANVDGVEHRTITELKLYEFGPVVFPAYPTTTAGLRSMVPDEARIATVPSITSATSRAIGAHAAGPDATAEEHARYRAALEVAERDLQRQSEALEAHRE